MTNSVLIASPERNLSRLKLIKTYFRMKMPLIKAYCIGFVFIVCSVSFIVCVGLCATATW
jgi:hypothetical protein